MRTGRPSRDNKPPKDRLLAAAIRLFKTSGPNATVDEICREARCVRPALYGSYEGRVDLVKKSFEAEIKRADEIFADAVSQVMTSLALRDELTELIKQVKKEAGDATSPIGLGVIFLLGRTGDMEVQRAAETTMGQIAEAFVGRFPEPSRGPQFQREANDFIRAVFFGVLLEELARSTALMNSAADQGVEALARAWDEGNISLHAPALVYVAEN